MKRNFFRILTAAVLCCAMLAGLCLTASAEPVKLVVATWDGGNNDQMQRTLADAFTEKPALKWNICPSPATPPNTRISWP